MDEEMKSILQQILAEQKRLATEQNRQGDLIVQLIERVSLINNEVASLHTELTDNLSEVKTTVNTQIDQLAKDVAIAETVAYNSAAKVAALHLFK